MNTAEFFHSVFLAGARSAQAIVDEALNNVKRLVADRLSGRSVSSLSDLAPLTFSEIFYLRVLF